MLGVACPFAAVSILSPELTGSLGQHFASLAEGLVGQAKLLLPLVIAGYGLHFLFPRSRRPVQMTWAPTLLWCNLVLLAQRMGEQGGQLGTFFDEILLRSVGPVGAWMVAVLGLPVCLSWVFRIRLADVSHWIAEKLHAVQDWVNHALDGLRANYQAQGPSRLAWVSSEDDLAVEGSTDFYDSPSLSDSLERPLPFHSLEGAPTSGKILGRSVPDPKPVGKKGPIQNRDLRSNLEPPWDQSEEDELPFEGTRLQPRGRDKNPVRRGTHSDGPSGEFPALAGTGVGGEAVMPTSPLKAPRGPNSTKTSSPLVTTVGKATEPAALEDSLEPLPNVSPTVAGGVTEILDFRGHDISHSMEEVLAPISFEPSGEVEEMAVAQQSSPVQRDLPARVGKQQETPLPTLGGKGGTAREAIVTESVDLTGPLADREESSFESDQDEPIQHLSAGLNQADECPVAEEMVEVVEESGEPLDEELVLEVPPPCKAEPTADGPPRRFTEIAADGQMLLFPEPEKEPAPTYRLPPLALLNDSPGAHVTKVCEDKSAELLDALSSFGVAANLLDIVRGPAVTRYELQPARGVKVSRFTSLTNDIALALAATAVRIEAPIPGKSAIGIEVPNANTDLVVIKDIIASQRFRKSVGMSIALGKDLGGNPIFANLQKMPHLLVAGTTGSGKSVCVNALILSLLYRFSPREVQILMIDPKQVELSIYEGIPHLICLSKGADGAPAKKEGAIICDPKKAALALHQIVELMEFRYGLFAQVRVRNLEEYNQTGEDPLPWVVVIIDELADLMMVAAKTVETSICRIAQKARAAGIHLVLATQRPSADVITGLIKVNVPSRIAFAVSSQVDSRVILDTGGAEQLLGKGDMLFCPVDASDPRRVQGCFVTNEEILRIVEWWKAQASPENLIQLKAAEVSESEDQEEEEGDADDELVQQALGVILKRRQASASLLQTELKVGYARARRLIYLMEKKGYIGPQDGSKPRKILYGAPE